MQDESYKLILIESHKIQCQELSLLGSLKWVSVIDYTDVEHKTWIYHHNRENKQHSMQQLYIYPSSTKT